jgi:hypothetical protein
MKEVPSMLVEELNSSSGSESDSDSCSAFEGHVGTELRITRRSSLIPGISQQGGPRAMDFKTTQ